MPPPFPSPTNVTATATLSHLTQQPQPTGTSLSLLKPQTPSPSLPHILSLRKTNDRHRHPLLLPLSQPPPPPPSPHLPATTTTTTTAIASFFPSHPANSQRRPLFHPQQIATTTPFHLPPKLLCLPHTLSLSPNSSTHPLSLSPTVSHSLFLPQDQQFRPLPLPLWFGPTSQTVVLSLTKHSGRPLPRSLNTSAATTPPPPPSYHLPAAATATASPSISSISDRRLLPSGSPRQSHSPFPSLQPGGSPVSSLCLPKKGETDSPTLSFSPKNQSPPPFLSPAAPPSSPSPQFHSSLPFP